MTFGGGPGICTYTMTLQQLNIELGIGASGAVTTGKVQALNVEAVVGTCQYPPAAASIANYTFMSATPSATGTTLTFQGDATNKGKATLTINLSSASSVYTAALTFHRTDFPPPLDWKVAATVKLSPS